MLARTLRMVFPSEPVAFIIAMASDKDSYNFCTQLLPGLYSSLFRGTYPGICISLGLMCCLSMEGNVCNRKFGKGGGDH